MHSVHFKNLTAAKSVVPLSPPSTGRLGDGRTAAPPTTPSCSGISVEDPTAVARDMQKLWVRQPKPHLSSFDAVGYRAALCVSLVPHDICRARTKLNTSMSPRLSSPATRTVKHHAVTFVHAGGFVRSKSCEQLAKGKPDERSKFNRINMD
jgi:hypothetical protein